MGIVLSPRHDEHHSLSLADFPNHRDMGLGLLLAPPCPIAPGTQRELPVSGSASDHVSFLHSVPYTSLIPLFQTTPRQTQ